MVPRRPSFVPAQAVELRSLWQEQACVVVGLRRFGCIVCRWIARDLSSLKGLLDLHGVRLVGVGPEARGLQEFLDGGYFSGGACDAAPPTPEPPPQPLPCPVPTLRAFATPSLPRTFSVQEGLASVSVLLTSPAPCSCGHHLHPLP